ncbi:MAG: V-type ATP synthase subunit E [Treponema sp.]|nr:V-type ATP synthase subunit E [Treponema sp.]
MEIQVQELIDKIKKDGIDTASQEASRIKTDAELEAKSIIENARKEADGIVSRSKQDADRAEKAGVAALQQASRNLILVFKDEVQALLNKIVNDCVSASYNDDVLKASLPEILKNWTVKGTDSLSVILPEKDLSRLQGFFNDKLKNELSKGVELKSDRKLSSGFRISNKEGSLYYDFSPEAVAQLLGAYLNPKLAEILKDSAKGN